MSILNKLMTAVRGLLTEGGQAIVDKNAITIVEQEIRDAKQELATSRNNLANLMGKRTVEANKLAEKRAKLTEYGSYIEKLLAAGDEATAEEVAGRYAQVERELALIEAVVAEFDKNIGVLKTKSSEAEQAIKGMESKAASIKATDSVIKASAAVSAAHSGTNTRLRSALDSMDRLEARQAEQLAQIDAANSLANESSGADLEARLQAKGVMPGNVVASDVLARFRKSETTAA